MTFSIESLTPPEVHPEGGDEVEVRLSARCSVVELSIDGERVEASASEKLVRFTTPPRPEPWEERGVGRVELQCRQFLDTHRFRNDRASAGLVYSPAALNPPLPIVEREPQGNQIVISAVARVTFSEALDPDTLEGNVLIEGVTGAVSWDEQALTATFTPDAPLEVDGEYVVRVRGGEDGVRSAVRRRPFAEDNSWRFRTRD